MMSQALGLPGAGDERVDDCIYYLLVHAYIHTYILAPT